MTLSLGGYCVVTRWLLSAVAVAIVLGCDYHGIAIAVTTSLISD